MINVKATKTAKTENPAERYATKEAELSRLPYVFGMVLAGIAVYLKAFFPARAEELAAGLADHEGQPETAPRHRADLTGSSDAPEELREDAPASSSPTSFGTTAPGFAPLSGAPFYTDFMAAEEPFNWQFSISPLARLRQAANDNRPVSAMLDGFATVATLSAAPSLALAEDGEDSPPSDDDEEEEDDDDSVANRAPRLSGGVLLADVSGCAILAIGLADLLKNATDPDGDTLTVKNLTISRGELVATPNGWSFASGQLFGPITITYQVTDGEFSVLQVAHFEVLRKRLAGTGGDDVLEGSACGDEIDGGSGNDEIDARGGDDVVRAGSGDDLMRGGDGDDVLMAGLGDDIVFGGAGDDHIGGGAGDDRLRGEDGDDVIFGDAGDDFLDGGAGRDVLDGGNGNDIVFGGSGDDALTGGAGNDRLEDGTGSDTVSGGTGDDVVVAAADGADDTYDGGSDRDTLDYSASRQTVNVNLATGTASGADIGDDAVSGFEALGTGAGDDMITGSARGEILMGQTGNDHIDAGGGDDTVVGGAGDDDLAGEAGNDTIRDGSGSDVVAGGAGDDVVAAALDGDNDEYAGDAGTDTIDYSATTESVVIDLNEGTASCVETGVDMLSGFEVVNGGSGDDELGGAEGDETLRGLAGDDILVGEGGADILEGGSGDDMLDGGTGGDTLEGGLGNDLVEAGDGNDVVYAGAGDDTIHDGAGADLVDAGGGDDVVAAALDGDRDTYIGGEGSDTLDYSQATQGVTVDIAANRAVGIDVGEDVIAGFETYLTGKGADHVIVEGVSVVLAGGAGDDIFEFVAPREEAPAAVHEILDFEVGDHVRLSKYDVVEKTLETFEERFEEIYQKRIDAGDIAIRYSHELVDGATRTVIEADFDNDSAFETSIWMDGHRVLVAIEHTTAATTAINEEIA